MCLGKCSVYAEFVDVNMRLTSSAVLDIVLTLTLCHTNNLADTQQHGHAPTDKGILYKSEVSHNINMSAPADTSSQHLSGKNLATLRDFSHLVRISPSGVYHRLRNAARTLDSERGNLNPSVAGYLYHLLMTNGHFLATSAKWWRNIPKFEANSYTEISKDKSVTSSVKGIIRKVDVKIVSDIALVNGTILDVRPNEKTYMNHGPSSHSLHSDGAYAKAPDHAECAACGRLRRKRDEGSSDKTTRDYNSENITEAMDPVINETRSSTSQHGKETTSWTFSDATQKIEETKEVNNYTLLPTTALTVEVRHNVSTTTDSLDATTATNAGVDYPTNENSANQEGKLQSSCSDTSDFGQYGITALAVSVGMVVLLVYTLGMVLVIRRFLERKRIRALHCPYHRGGGPDWLDMRPGPLEFEPDGPITNSYLNLPDLDESSSSASDDGATRGDDPHNVSTFLLRQASQQKAEERLGKGNGEIQQDHVEITTTMNITEL